MKLCVFQGTFNPIHLAHLRVAQYVTSKYNFDKFLFIPASVPPHKDFDPDMSIHRLNMVKIAIKKFPKFEISDIEYKREGVSYTYLTIKELYSKFLIEDKIYFIIGTDAFDNIKNWYESDKLKELVRFIVFPREENFNASRYNELKSCGYDFIIETLSYRDISSSDLRNKIKNNESINDLVTKETEEYIKEHGLYRN